MLERPRWLRVFAVSSVLALVVTACAGVDDEQGAEPTPETPQDGVVTITATDYEFDAPKQIDASTVDLRLVNDGETAHEAALVKLEAGETREAFFEEFDAFVETEFSGPIPDAVYNGTTIIGDVQPGEDPLATESTMTSGSWILFCALSDADTESDEEDGSEQEPAADERESDERPHYQLGMWAELEVTGSEEPEFPEADGTITIEDYTFTGVDELTAGEHTLVAANQGPEQLHHVVAFDFGADVDVAGAEEAFQAMLAEEEGGEEEAEPGPEETPQDAEEEPGSEQDEPEEVFVSGLMSPGYGQTLTAELESGHTYLFACFIHDRAGGPPHAVAHDMYKAFTVS